MRLQQTTFPKMKLQKDILNRAQHDWDRDPDQRKNEAQQDKVTHI